MTLSLSDLALYAGALLVLFLTPGPVWVALIARALSGQMGRHTPVLLISLIWRLFRILL